MSSSSKEPSHTNRLIHESSPYLLQHAHNPVDWYSWGPEAFEAARRENKPIFLSVGYSTCYWCHVMERQSFENETIAAEMNRLLINIKVDREERPDVDQLYMTAVQVQTRHGGWPMSVFLTPDLRYFYGGTYFPPADAHGRPGFVTLTRAIADAYANRREDVERTADQFVGILSRAAQPPTPDSVIRFDRESVGQLIERSTSDYDRELGGFGGAPKFPRETLLELILDYLADQPGGRPSVLRSQMLHTLDAMADGGIRDQLGGGFHRYSTDAQWLVPHFEIMLYDNAMLGWVYAGAHRQTGEARYAKVAQGIFDFVLREMTSPDGAFFTAFDAEVDAQEGLSYLWTADEIETILGPQDAKLFNHVYGVDLGPNFADPHHGSGQPENNILFHPIPLSQAAAELKTDVDSLDARLAPMRQKLYEVRLKRKQPILDTKIITSWNALMIRALAHGGAILGEQRYIQAAVRAADYLLAHHRLPDGGLYRTSRDGKAKYNGFLDDYSFFAQAMVELSNVTGQRVWTDRAKELTQVMQERFGDSDNGGFFFTEQGAADILVRQMTASDSPLPSGNAVAAMVLTELGEQESARRTIGVFAGQVLEYGGGMSSMTQAALRVVRQFGPFAIEPGDREPAARPPAPRTSAANVVTVRTAWRSECELTVTLKIADTFHINANDVSGADIPLIATVVSVAGYDGELHVDYPPGEDQRFAFSEKPLRVYAGAAEIVVRFSKAITPGTVLQLNIKYQACTDDACLAPITKQEKITRNPA